MFLYLVSFFFIIFLFLWVGVSLKYKNNMLFVACLPCNVRALTTGNTDEKVDLWQEKAVFSLLVDDFLVS